MFSTLWGLGCHKLLRSAADIIEEHGYSNTMHYDPYSGGVNIVGALALACGSSVKKLERWDGDNSTIPVRNGLVAVFLELVTFIEAAVSTDIEEWCACHRGSDAISLLRTCASRIEVSVI